MTAKKNGVVVDSELGRDLRMLDGAFSLLRHPGAAAAIVQRLKTTLAQQVEAASGNEAESEGLNISRGKPRASEAELISRLEAIETAIFNLPEAFNGILLRNFKWIAVHGQAISTEDTSGTPIRPDKTVVRSFSTPPPFPILQKTELPTGWQTYQNDVKRNGPHNQGDYFLK